MSTPTTTGMQGVDDAVRALHKQIVQRFDGDTFGKSLVQADAEHPHQCAARDVDMRERVLRRKLPDQCKRSVASLPSAAMMGSIIDSKVRLISNTLDISRLMEGKSLVAMRRPRCIMAMVSECCSASRCPVRVCLVLVRARRESARRYLSCPSPKGTSPKRSLAGRYRYALERRDLGVGHRI